MSMEDDIRVDRAEGTHDWDWRTDPEHGFPAMLARTKTGMDVLTFWFGYNGDEADARRIARLPDLEAAFLAQSAELAALRERADALADLVENTLRLKAFPDIATAIVAYRNPDRHAAMLMAERVRDPDAKELEWAKQRARELGRD